MQSLDKINYSVIKGGNLQITYCTRIKICNSYKSCSIAAFMLCNELIFDLDKGCCLHRTVVAYINNTRNIIKIVS